MDEHVLKYIFINEFVINAYDPSEKTELEILVNDDTVLKIISTGVMYVASRRTGELVWLPFQRSK